MDVPTDVASGSTTSNCLPITNSALLPYNLPSH